MRPVQRRQHDRRGNACRHPSQHHRQLASQLPFQQGFAHAQYDRALYYREKVEDLIDLAVRSLQEILTDPKAPPSVKLKAALAIIQTASTPPAPKKQVELDIEKIVFQTTPAQTVTKDQFEPAPTVHNNAQPATETSAPSVHKDAQVTPKICAHSRPFAANSPARNAQCPCGSGKKYKRCCLNSPSLANAA